VTKQKKRILIFVVAYKAEKTIQQVLSRIPRALAARADIDLEVLVIDDCSLDRTFSEALQTSRYQNIPVRVWKNPENLGYGGNQKLGYRYAIQQGFDVVALLHGDGQYAPECLPDLLKPILFEECDVVFGSRMLNRRDALRGRMPLYKFVGNIVLTAVQNSLTGVRLSEWHSGYRIYSCRALRAIPFALNSNGFDFDTEIIIQLMQTKARIRELPIPIFYGDEIFHVNGMVYAANVVWACVQSRLQRYGICNDPRFNFAVTERHLDPAPLQQTSDGQRT
jgi:glycosyltransferase involved in cell wall biosynthesis